MSKTNHTAQNQAKKPYHSPLFEEIGDVKDLTQTSAPPPFSGSDGGSFPNNYAS